MASSNHRMWRVPPRGLAVAIAMFAAVLLIVSAATSAPAVCSSCHAMQPAANGLAAGSHAGTPCYRCHLAAGAWSWTAFKTRELTSMYPAALLGRSLSGPDDGVSDAACLSCHTRVMTGILKGKGTRIAHRSCAEGRQCVDCHGAESHGKAARWVRQPYMDDCVACHLEQKVTIQCDTCHVERSTAERIARGPWQVTHGPNWRKTHAMGDLQLCVTCHPATKCVQCHGVPLPHPTDFGRTHGALAAAPGAKCTDCHDRKGFCDACHGTPMPHAAGFLAKHSKIAKSREDAACLKCHYDYDCASCHQAHTHPGNTKGTLRSRTLPDVKKP
jgi:hypothetical protein